MAPELLESESEAISFIFNEIGWPEQLSALIKSAGLAAEEFESLL